MEPRRPRRGLSPHPAAPAPKAGAFSCPNAEESSAPRKRSEKVAQTSSLHSFKIGVAWASMFRPTDETPVPRKTSKFSCLRVIGHWSLVIGHWSLVIGHWSLVIGHWSLVIGHWSLALVIGHWSLVIGHWSLVIGHWSLVIPRLRRGPIQRTPHAQPRLLHHMRINLRRLHALMPEQILHRPYIDAVLQ